MIFHNQQTHIFNEQFVAYDLFRKDFWQQKNLTITLLDGFDLLFLSMDYLLPPQTFLL
jgi:hypothetical protein